MGTDGYASDKTPREAWDMLSAVAKSVMIDVRTTVEWEYVGIPDLSSIGKEIRLIPWLEFPDMQPNTGFVEQASHRISAHNTPVLLICRSGQRSISAARALTKAGYTRCYNVLEGFEGDRCPEGRRGSVGGWKVAGLPWHQR